MHDNVKEYIIIHGSVNNMGGWVQESNKSYSTYTLWANVTYYKISVRIIGVSHTMKDLKKESAYGMGKVNVGWHIETLDQKILVAFLAG
jgi:hypothetical protein